MTRPLAAAAGLLLAAAPAPAGSPATAAINAHIAGKWKEVGVARPAGRATDLEFLRRAFVDLIGRIPSADEVRDFEADAGGDKRGRLVRRLLHDAAYTPRVYGTPATAPGPDGKRVPVAYDYAGEYADHWADVWAVWLLTRSAHPGYRDRLHGWLADQFRADRPYPEVVTALLTAGGKSSESGAANFLFAHLGEGVPDGRQPELGRFDAVPVTSRVTRLFLGIQTQCVQCHDHPFNKEWVQADFWGVNAFFRQTVRSADPSPGGRGAVMAADPVDVELADDPALNRTGVVFYERRDGKLLATRPNFLKDYAAAVDDKPSAKPMPAGSAARSRRQALAAYVVAHDNFAKAYVSRIWGHLFGRGLHKEPAVDDFGSNNELVHPELLDALAGEFVKYGYDTKKLLEWICGSDVYQLSHEANPAYADPKYDPYFARMPLKAMSPEVLFASLMTATRADAPPPKGLPADGRKALKERRDRWLDKLVRGFGDDEGNERTFNGTVIQALLMMNGDELNGEIGRRANNAVEAAVRRHTRGGVTSPVRVFDELFVAAVGRHPTPAEVRTLSQFLSGTRKVTVELSAAEPARDRWGSGAGSDWGADKPSAKPPAAKAEKAEPAKPAKPKTVTGTLPPAAANDVGFYQDVFWALLNTNEFILNH